ncbi:hypothetical protein ADIAG_00568 [Paeniglutamicibacter gangotriensis Lz1y]|uniref:Uncharacterized protein n=1 Tax=Paeniglutamicibacter gangotriensis Lz1y TaxID=1276920 RepID=M7N020_9MICC|nr:hypothetical protein ADIAG_00568 [Paeniglutamicibacter gangotriensis Lz1y]
MCSAYIGSSEEAEGLSCSLQLLNAKFIADRTKTSVSALMEVASPMYKGAPPDSIKQSVAEVLTDSIRIGTAHDEYSEMDCPIDDQCASYVMALLLLIGRMTDKLSTGEAYNH